MRTMTTVSESSKVITVTPNGPVTTSPAKPIVGMATTSDGKCYGLVAADGGIFALSNDGAIYAFGNAVYRGGAN